MDPSMERRKTKVNELKNTILQIAGPGQSHTSHHPVPNKAEPIMRFLSMTHLFFHEKCQISEKRGFSFLEIKKCQTSDTHKAHAITKASVESHVPNRSKNHCTLTGEIISE
jgi:hypothetical protein